MHSVHNEDIDQGVVDLDNMQGMIRPILGRHG